MPPGQVVRDHSGHRGHASSKNVEISPVIVVVPGSAGRSSPCMPEFAGADSNKNRPNVPPGRMEPALCAIWAGLLRITPVTRDATGPFSPLGWRPVDAANHQERRACFGAVRFLVAWVYSARAVAWA